MTHTKDLLVADKARALAVDLLGRDEFYADDVLRDMTSRAALDIGAAIAIATTTDTPGEFATEIDPAVGASFRLECLLLISRDLKILDAKAFAGLEARTQELQRMLISLRASAQRGFAGSTRRRPRLKPV